MLLQTESLFQESLDNLQSEQIAYPAPLSGVFEDKVSWLYIPQP